MTELSTDHANKLALLVAAGSYGASLADVGIGTALWFGLMGLAEITNNRTPPQRAVATEKARQTLREHQRMGAWA